MKYVRHNGIEFPLVQIKNADMDRLLNERKWQDFKALIPCYYDSRGNYWPSTGFVEDIFEK